MLLTNSAHLPLRHIIPKAFHITNFIRYKSVKPTYDDLSSYLEYADFVQVNKDTTVFQGTIFEMRAKEKLEKALKIKNLRHAGGAFDNGIDLIGSLDILQYKTDKEPRKAVPLKGKRVKPLILRKRTDLDVIIQCKSFSSKVTAKEIREQSGIFNFNIRRTDRNNSLMIMAASSVLTSQGLTQLDTVDIPMIYCQISRLRQIAENPYDLSSYEGGDLLGFYFNPYALALFEGTSFYEHTQSSCI
ncbi:hypothetical protein BN7_3641 [Wickerhamomyces ciferrii]|uniref:Required for respiratory growth protein 7, mitochondrial n=1 Tax=Wickerhamomyces ciferrii (strain ATCC 14091 / BCRC 22168 / CBS 111 / JCM 3599 / NBRC 0793 / NRRL Y-1031 F-60-10) TaxID=1206466 RepID=K0KPH8_WICCF|nr:uncharacterized protein BN7_3641 [Wickerhamomyces ciferrii]CCH44082.1 hypothetical protein BN7_3641 [Wickerhamomyces ciferrii]